MAYALTVRRNPRARRLRLRIDTANGAVLLTVPPRTSEAHARLWADGHRDWIERQLATLPAACPIAPGATIPFRGDTLVVDWAPGHPRAPLLDGDRLRVGGPADAVSRRVLAWLRAQALVLLDSETREIASAAGVAIGRVATGDARTRWGSCSSGGDIRYNWRLVLAPPAVMRATVAHEVAHRLHMDHGPRFHAAERRLLGRDPAPERAWLRVHGAALHRVGLAR